MPVAKPSKTVRLRLVAEYDLREELVGVLLFCDPKSAFSFLTSQFMPERLRVERVGKLCCPYGLRGDPHDCLKKRIEKGKRGKR